MGETDILVQDIQIRYKNKEETILITGRNYPIIPSQKQSLVELTGNIYSDRSPFHPNEITPVRPYLITKDMTYEDAMNLFVGLKNNDNTKSINFRFLKREDKNEHYYLHAEAERTKLKLLPDIFYQPEYVPGTSATTVVRNRMGKYPYTLLSQHGDLWIADSQLTLEQFVKLPTSALDSEFMHWEDYDIDLKGLDATQESMIKYLKKSSTASIEGVDLEYMDHNTLTKLIEKHFNENRNNHELGIFEKPMTIQMTKEIIENGEKKYQIKYFQHILGESKTIEKKLKFGDAKIVQFKAKDHEEMIEQFNASTAEDPPTILLTVNGMKYDMIKLPKFGLRFFERKPGVRATAGFFKRTEIPGVYHIDTFPFAQNNLPFTINKKGMTICQLINNSYEEKSNRIIYDKDLDYPDLSRMTIEQILNNVKSMEELQKYGCNDTIPILKAKRYLLPMIYLLGKIYETGPGNICTASKSTLAFNVFNNEYLKKHKEYFDWEKLKIEYSFYKTNEAFLDFTQEISSIGTKERLRKNISPSFDMSEPVSMFYIAPFTAIYSEMINKNPNIKEALEYINPKKRKDATLLERFTIIHSIEEGYLTPHVFLDSQNKFKDIKNTDVAKKTISKYNDLITNFTPKNESGNFYCFDSRIADTKEFKDTIHNLGFELTRGLLFNINPGSFVLSDGFDIYKREIDYTGKRGFSSLYIENMTDKMFLKTFSVGPDYVIETFGNFFKDLHDNNLDKKMLTYYRKKIAKDHKDFSAGSQLQERIKAIVDFKLKKGDTLAYGTINERITTEEFIKLTDEIIYSKKNKKNIINEYMEKMMKYVEPVLPYYDLDQEDAIDLLTSGQYKKILNTKTFFPNR